ncbi:DUF4331 domain-containing protein [Actinoplanes sp. TBRC 11911]|uniref:DUF4331 family protein n=1 Tax=Actinoplanes sp. TBRC 11911 TaxID=2729386 RepID=UPI00145EAD6A|nr:DUF4331 family protein [Actinoplanes sp. TBRC 11911]NMO49968.1 DUF4331 domain-containing protein [Actinoplanes sp. TBRC 11911]
MSNHYSAANLRFPGDDARLDFTDLYAFTSPDDHGKTVLIIDLNPYTTGMSAMPPFLMKSEFHPDGIYRINIDTDGDSRADAAFTFIFSEFKDGRQTGTAYFATGSQAREPDAVGQVLISGVPVGFDAGAEPVEAGPIRLFIGVRSDPFFADADGSFHGFRWTGQDAFADRNILSIALEVPNEMLSVHSAIGLWATVGVRRDGEIIQVDRGGHPTINPFINPNNVKNEYNLRQPSDDLANYLELWSKLLESNGYSPAEAQKAALIVLPDILRYDRSQPAGYPNGRALTDDVFSARFAWLTNGKVGPDGLQPHDDMLKEFPYLGPPNRYPGA